MFRSIYIVGYISLFVYAGSVSAFQSHVSNHLSTYAGEEKRLIKSLSADDIEQLKAGRGWGLAKAAELNGVPGPSHLLQMKKEIQLSDEQEEKIKHLYANMKQQAKSLGNKLIDLENKLNIAFAAGSVTKKSLRTMLDEIANVRKELRFVHLATHLETPSILTRNQIVTYNKLRGYLNDGSSVAGHKGHH